MTQRNPREMLPKEPSEVFADQGKVQRCRLIRIVKYFNPDIPWKNECRINSCLSSRPLGGYFAGARISASLHAKRSHQEGSRNSGGTPVKKPCPRDQSAGDHVSHRIWLGFAASLFSVRKLRPSKVHISTLYNHRCSCEKMNTKHDTKVPYRITCPMAIHCHIRQLPTRDPFPAPAIDSEKLGIEREI